MSHISSNNADPHAVFAQMVYGLGKPDDVFLAISTTGDSANIVYACMTARAMGIETVGGAAAAES